MTIISQREARRLRKRVEELESIQRQQRVAWICAYPGGTLLGAITVKSEEWHIVRTARTLRHACVVVQRAGSLELEVYALPVAAP